MVIGRSFGTLYGSDPIEPAALGKPTLIGPRYGDFEQIVRAFTQMGGVEVVKDEAALADALFGLLTNPAARRDRADRARACIRDNQGATNRHATLVVSLARATANSHK